MNKIKIKVIPNSKKEEIARTNAELIVKTKAPAEKGKANKAVIKLLSKYFNAGIRIMSGKTSRKKIIEVLK